MSHTATHETSIRVLDVNFLREVVEMVAAKHSGTNIARQSARRNYLAEDTMIRTYHQAWNADDRPEVTIALFTDQVFRGVGMIVNPETKVLSFQLDEWGAIRESKALRDEIVQTYVATAYERSAIKIGYHVRNIKPLENESGLVVLRASRVAQGVK